MKQVKVEIHRRQLLVLVNLSLDLILDPILIPISLTRRKELDPSICQLRDRILQRP
jgi:hypothetical protein